MGDPNVIFIVVDTLRKDYAKPLEKELKELGFISYENTIAPAPWTIPSHASIFTGLYQRYMELMKQDMEQENIQNSKKIITF